MLTQAGNVAQSLNQSASGIAQVSTNVTSQTSTVVAQINQYASQIAALNQQVQTERGGPARTKASTRICTTRSRVCRSSPIFPPFRTPTVRSTCIWAGRLRTGAGSRRDADVSEQRVESNQVPRRVGPRRYCRGQQRTIGRADYRKEHHAPQLSRRSEYAFAIAGRYGEHDARRRCG